MKRPSSLGIQLAFLPPFLYGFCNHIFKSFILHGLICTMCGHCFNLAIVPVIYYRRKYSEVKIHQPLCIFIASVKVLSAVGHDQADQRFQKLLTCLSHPPSYTCVRASTHLAPLEDIRQKLGEELKKVRTFI